MENILFYNGEVVTVDEDDTVCEAVWVKGNKIKKTGNNDIEELIKESGEEYERIDLKGRTLLPGFVDSHIHIAYSSTPADMAIDFSKEAGISSIEDVKAKVKAEVAKLKPGEWLRGVGYNESDFKEKRYISRYDLDEVAPNNPVMINRACGHIISFNTMAMEIGHYFDGKQEYPETHVFMEDGQPTGAMNDAASQILLQYTDSILPDEYMLESLEKYAENFRKHGITSAHDAGLFGKDTFRVLQKFSERENTHFRQNPMIFTVFGNDAQKEVVAAAIEAGFYSGIGNEKFRMGPIKIMIDGSTSGPTPAMRETYDGGINNPLSFTEEDVEKLVIDSHKAGFQVTAHAVGDKAVETMLDAFEKAQELYPREDPRHRIEHCAFTPKDLVDRIKNLGVIPISNPSFFSLYGNIYNRAYGDRVENMFALKTFKEEGIIAAIGSDSPVTECSTIRSLHGMLYRKHWASGEVCAPEQTINMLDAIRCFTYNGAYASFEEDIKGSLEPGKLADMAIMSRSILDCTEEELLDAKVDMTVFDGEVVYRR